MTRKIINTLLADVAAALPNNTAQEISAADVRSAILDTIESVTPAIARASGTASPGLNIALTTTPQKLPASFYTAFLSGNPALMEARGAPNGDLLVKTNIGRLQAQAALVLIAPSGSDIVFTLGQNGTLIVPRPVVTGRGAGNPVSAEFSWMFQTLNINDAFDIWAYGLAAGANITLQGMNLQGILLPQYVV